MKTIRYEQEWLDFLFEHFSFDQDEIWCCDEAFQAEHPQTAIE